MGDFEGHVYFSFFKAARGLLEGITKSIFEVCHWYCEMIHIIHFEMQMDRSDKYNSQYRRFLTTLVGDERIQMSFLRPFYS